MVLVCLRAVDFSSGCSFRAVNFLALASPTSGDFELGRYLLLVLTLLDLRLSKAAFLLDFLILQGLFLVLSYSSSVVGTINLSNETGIEG